jgi:hypothetical protein
MESQQQAGTQADKLIAAVLEAGVELFHSPEGDGYASFPVCAHLETWSLRTRKFREWIILQYFQREGRAPGGQALQVALNTLIAKACYEGEERQVFIRTAAYNGSVYIDLANQSWQCVEITPSGWQVLNEPPVRFVRRRGMRALPVPLRGGCLATLRQFVNVAGDADWVLSVSWLLAALRPSGPYPLLVLHGPQGSAKSTTARLLRDFVDPNAAPIRSEPKDPRDLMIAATNGWVIALDNLSYVPAWLSDALCRLATGGGFATRELYSDSEEVLFEAMRPVILTGIEELATRGDLLDRSIVLYLPSIPDGGRRAEQDFWREFETERPAILGALFDAFSTALRNLPTTKLDCLPRMADFALWATAAEEAIAQKGAFWQAYHGNQQDANEIALEGSLVAGAVEQFMLTQGGFQGTCSELLEVLTNLIGEEKRRERNWPKNAQALSGRLRRLSSNLRRAGIAVQFTRDKLPDRRRTVSIQTARETSSRSSASSEVPCSQHGAGTMVDAPESSLPGTSSIPHPNKERNMDDVDGPGRSFSPTVTSGQERESWEL